LRGPFPPRYALVRPAALAFAFALMSPAFAALGVTLARNAPVLVISDVPVRAAFDPNDPLYSVQWALPSVRAPQAWDVNFGDRGIVVAVVDTGIPDTHPDMNANFWVNPGEDLNRDGAVQPSERNGIDDERDGYIDDFYGWDFVDGDNDPDDGGATGGTYHGTGVAGALAAEWNNGDDIAGAAQVSIMNLRALDPTGQGSSLNTSRAIRFAADHGARVINLSLGTNETFTGPTDMQLAIDYAWSRGAIIIAAAGNGDPATGLGRATLDFPARLPNVLAVGALDEAETRARFSNYGNGLDLSAPGESIITLHPTAPFQTLSGTSLAAPYVSAAAALVLSAEPTLTNVEVWNILNDTARTIGSQYEYGWGEVDYLSAVTALNRPFVSVNSAPGTVARSSTFSIGWSILGPAGLPVTDTHIEWGTASGVLGNSTALLTGLTRQAYTETAMRMPEGASTLYFKAVATVNGTQYESQERSVAVTTLPDFLFVLYQLFSSNLLYLALFILALAAVVAFVPQRRARSRRVAYHPRTIAPVYRPAAPSGPPSPPPAAVRPAPPIEFVRPSPPPPPPPAPSVPQAPIAAPPAPAAPAKKRCPACGTLVNAENLFCFFCGQPFR